MPIASPSTPTAPSDNLSSTSEGKVTDSASDRQEGSVRSSLCERVDEDVSANNQENKGQSESDKPAFSIDEKTEGNKAAYDAAKRLLEAAGLEVVEVSDAEARAKLDGNKKTPVNGQPNRANEKPTSGSVLLSISGNSSSNRAASKEAEAKIAKKNKSAKHKIKNYKNGDFVVEMDSLPAT